MSAPTLPALVPAPRPASAPRGTAAPAPPVLDVVVPVYDEERDLGPSVRRLHAYLTAHVPFTFRITVADNASTDGTLALARALARELDGVEVVHLEQKGRGRALARVWADSDAAVLAYTDVDLSTDLSALLPLVAPLVSGHSDLAIGTRLARGARVVRGPKREVISRCYNLLLATTLGARFSDAQCGFKAIRADAARGLLPLVADTGWFFDTELLVLAQRGGLRIHEVPVDWVDDPDSRVEVVATAAADLRGIARLARSLAVGRLPLARLRAELGRAPLARPTPAGSLLSEMLRFAGIGVISTVAFVVLYALLRTGLPAQAANVVALLATSVGNTAANRRLTFGIRGRRGALRGQVESLAVLGLGLALTSGALALLGLLAPAAGAAAELAVLVAANAAAAVLRFTALRSWVFHPTRARVIHERRAQGPLG